MVTNNVFLIAAPHIATNAMHGTLYMIGDKYAGRALDITKRTVLTICSTRLPSQIEPHGVSTQ